MGVPGVGRRVHVLRQLLGEAEIQDLDLTPIGQKKIGRLDVAVQDALCVHGIERIGHLNGHVDYLADRQRPSRQQVTQRRAL